MCILQSSPPKSSIKLSSKLSDCEGAGQGGHKAYHCIPDRDTAEVPGEGQESSLNNDKA